MESDGEEGSLHSIKTIELDVESDSIDTNEQSTESDSTEIK